MEQSSELFNVAEKSHAITVSRRFSGAQQPLLFLPHQSVPRTLQHSVPVQVQQSPRILRPMVQSPRGQLLQHLPQSVQITRQVSRSSKATQAYTRWSSKRHPLIVNTMSKCLHSETHGMVVRAETNQQFSESDFCERSKPCCHVSNTIHSEDVCNLSVVIEYWCYLACNTVLSYLKLESILSVWAHLRTLCACEQLVRPLGWECSACPYRLRTIISDKAKVLARSIACHIIDRSPSLKPSSGLVLVLLGLCACVELVA
eukprot:4928047-Amphidinium_carterae.1